MAAILASGKVIKGGKVIGSKRSSSSSGSSLKARIVDNKTGKVVQEGVFKLEKKKSGGGSSRQSVSGSVQNIATVQLRNTQTGRTTTEKIDLNTGRTISSTQKQSVVATLEEPQKRSLLQQLRSSVEPKTTDRGFVRGVKGFASAAIDDIIILPIAVAKTSTRAILGDEVARAQVRTAAKLATDPNTINSFGIALGVLAQSSDPAARASLGTLFIPSSTVAKARKGFDVDVSTSRYVSSTNLKTGSTRTVIDTTGTLKNGRPFTQKTTLSYRPKDGTVVGNSKVNYGEGTQTTQISLKDKGAFFENTKTGEKISKKKLVGQTNFTIKERTISDRKLIGSTVLEETGFTKGQRAAVFVKTTKGTISPQGKVTAVVRTRQSLLDFRKRLRDSRDIFKDALSIKGSINATVIRSKIKKKEYDPRKVEQFLNAIDWDINIVNGLDKRTRLANALGIRKDSKLLKDILDEFGELKTKVKGKSKTVAVEKKEKANRLLFSGLIIPPSLIDFVPKNPLKKKQITKAFNVSNDITVPDLKIKIKAYKQYFRLKLIPVRGYGKILERLQRLLDKKTTKVKTKAVQKKKATTVKKKTASKTKTKSKSKKKSVRKVISKPKLKKKPVKERKVRKRVRVKIDTETKKKTQTKRIGYVVTVKKGDKVVGKNAVLLPLNRALKFGRDYTDRFIEASFEIEEKGKTAIKDLKTRPSLNKFRLKKGKNPKVRIFVEKRSKRLDKAPEKKQISAAKAIKKANKKLTGIKRKKSSNNKRKTVKSRKKK